MKGAGDTIRSMCRVGVGGRSTVTELLSYLVPGLAGRTGEMGGLIVWH